MVETPTIKIMGRTTRLPSKQGELFDRIFQSGRGHVAVAAPRLVAQLLRALWASRCSLPSNAENNTAEEARFSAWLDQFVSELQGGSGMPLEETIRDFSGRTTLP